MAENIIPHYEAVKKVLRFYHPDTDFILACHDCGQSYPDNAEMGMIQTHFQISHDTDKVSLDLVFIGEGKPPRGD